MNEALNPLNRSQVTLEGLEVERGEPDGAPRRADRVVWVQDGQVLLDGSPAKLLATSQEFRDWVDASNRATMDIRIED